MEGIKRTAGSALTKGPVIDDVANPVVTPQGEPLEMPLASVEQSAASDGVEKGGALVGYQERLVVRPRVAWADHFQLLAAVQVGAQVTCLHAVQQEIEDGLSPYVAVGDSDGALHVFQPTGQLVCEHSSAARSPVTALVSFPKGPLETWLVSGHSDGALVLHCLAEADIAGGSDDPPGAKIVSHGSLRAAGGGLRQSQNEPGASEGEARSLVENEALLGGSESEGEVKILHMLRRGGSQLLLAADATGGLEIFDLTERKRLGILYKRSRILAFQKPLTSSRVVFVSKSGVGRVDLTRMMMHPVECPGLDGIVLESFAFDVNGRSKGYGIVEGGKEMVVVNVGGDGRGVNCQLLARRKGAFEGATALQAIKGYLVARSEHGADVFNTSLPKFGAGKAVLARPLFTVPSAEITAAFNWHPASSPQESLSVPPPFATNKDRLVVLAFPGGLVGMYRSELPLPRVPNLAASFPGTPVFIAIVMVAATWQILLRRPARSASAFSAEGLGKWTEDDLREFVKQHVSGNRAESGRNPDKSGRNPDGNRSSGSWRESPSSSREGSIDRPRTRERSVERPGGERPGANPPPRNVAADFARAGEKENIPRVPVRQGSARKEDPGGGLRETCWGICALGRLV
ncbi:hypothetical protein KFL_000070080 [Klebsormidium nitens]|uniref:Uncharacterized protein n=1 Tax=Klebsormidium nitens TaxID=105231 RepID=A0A1Y1HNA8_KLENI|nr:hypothetical protein KFL_000070080 [Klebsormidium nitens]|eukprot:GAQ78037.1 hypothetical protein KFL_000070080 [Klebsormidium nitens]